MEHTTSEVLSQGSAEAERTGWEELVRLYGAVLERRIGRELWRVGLRPRPELVEELAQEVYCRLLAGGMSRLRGCRAHCEGAVLAYLAKAAASVVLDHLREERAAKRGIGRRVQLGRRDEAFFAEVADPLPTPEERLLIRERRRLLLERCCGRARRRVRQRALWVVGLALFGDWRSHEISRALEGRLASSSVDSLVRRATARLTPADRELLWR